MHKADLQSRLLLLSIEWPSSLSPFKRGALSKRERGWLREFSCLKAQCYKPADRAMLLAKIREEWKSEAAFDEFVRTELYNVLVQSKMQYQQRILNIAGNAFELIFGVRARIREACDALHARMRDDAGLANGIVCLSATAGLTWGKE